MTTVNDVIRYIDVSRTHIDSAYLRTVADRIQVARILAGRITALDLAEAITLHTDENWSRAKVANVESGRKAITLGDVETIAETFRVRYGLGYVTVDWLMGADATTLETGNSPGYRTERASGSDDLIDLTDPTMAAEAA